MRNSKLQKLERSDGRDIAGSYFRPRRAAALLHQQQHQQNQRTLAPSLSNAWKSTLALAGTAGQTASAWLTPTNHHQHMNQMQHGQLAHQQHPTGGAYNQQQMALSRTWNGSQYSTSMQHLAIDSGIPNGIQSKHYGIYRLFNLIFNF